MMKRSRRVVIKAAAVGLAAANLGCPLFEAPDPPSRVVERVERAGAGDVRTASNEALQMWFNKRGDLAVEVTRLCATSAAERMPGRTEARVCASARLSAFFTFVPYKGDGKSYDCCSAGKVR
jgi:hypothetical protein